MSGHSYLQLPRWWPLLATLASAAALGAHAPPLPTRVVQLQPVELTLSAEAIVEAVNQATLAAQVSGRIVDVYVDAGQAVRKGDLLMKIDSREATEAAAGASAQLVNARANYQRMLGLRQQGFVSQAAVDKAKADLDAAQATQGQTSVVVDHTAVRAPISGIVAQRLTELGEMAVPGMHARLHFVIGRSSKMSVPQTAIVRRGEVAAVYVQNEAGALALRQLRLGEAVGAGEVEVLAGLQAGERVVLDPLKAAVQIKSAARLDK